MLQLDEVFFMASLSPLLFVMCLVPLSIVLRKAKVGYELGKKKGKANHLLFMNDLKLYDKTEKELNLLLHTVRIFSKDKLWI